MKAFILLIVTTAFFMNPIFITGSEAHLRMIVPFKSHYRIQHPHQTFHHYRAYYVRLHDSKVNTAVEKEYDRNHDGVIGPKEREEMIKDGKS